MNRKNIAAILIKASLVAITFSGCIIVIGMILAFIVAALATFMIWLPAFGLYVLGVNIYGEEEYEFEFLGGKVYAKKKMANIVWE